MSEQELRNVEARLGRLEDAGIAGMLSAQRQASSEDEAWTSSQIKEFILSLLNEKDRALEMAEREREKAASALREQLTERIATGDNNLREHVTAQVGQLRQMVENTETLSTARFDSAQTAIDKAEQATEKRFESVNEFRAVLTDQQQHLVNRQVLSTMSDKLQTAIDRNREDLAQLGKRLDLREGQEAGSRLTTGTLVTILTVGVGVIGLIVVLANVVTT